MDQEQSVNREKFFAAVRQTDASVEAIALELVEWIEKHEIWNVKYTGVYVSARSPGGTEVFYIAPNAGNFHDKTYIELRHFTRKEMLESIVLEKLVPELPESANYNKKLNKTKRKVCAPWIELQWLKHGNAMGKLKECMEDFYTEEFLADEVNLKVIPNTDLPRIDSDSGSVDDLVSTLDHFRGHPNFVKWQPKWRHDITTLFCRLVRAVHQGELDLWFITDPKRRIRFGRKDKGDKNGTLHGYITLHSDKVDVELKETGEFHAMEKSQVTEDIVEIMEKFAVTITDGKKLESFNDSSRRQGFWPDDYDKGELVVEDQGVATVRDTSNVIHSLDKIHSFFSEQNFRIDLQQLRRYHISMKTRKFVVLSGISGTGKTWLAELYAAAVGARVKVVPVAPNWTSNEDLLGYFNPLDKTYHDTDFSLFLREAAQDFEENGELATHYHLVLDEMNLARVEYYFAKFLSLMELRSRSENGCALIELGNATVLFPPNLYFIGTVNIDETTHGFADKVYDRAQLIEMGITREAVVTHIGNTHHSQALLNIWDKVHVTAPFAFRVIDEIGAYVEASAELGVPWEEALDEQIVQKILPKVKGTSSRIGEILEYLILEFPEFKLTRAKASLMLEGFRNHGFASYF